MVFVSSLTRISRVISSVSRLVLIKNKVEIKYGKIDRASCT